MILLLMLGLAWGEPARPRVTLGLRAPITTLSLYAPATIEGYRVTSLIYEPLARVNPSTGEIEPWLAREWTRHGRRLRVELRRHVVFHDGHELAAEDVVKSLAAFRSPENHAATWWPLWENFTKARAVGADVVEFDARESSFENLRNLLTTLRIHRGTSGTGPFHHAKLRGESVALEAFTPWWHGPAPKFDLLIKRVNDLALARQMVGRGELDVFAASESNDEDLVEAGPGTGFWIDLNLRRAPFAAPENRRALARLWDRSRLNRTMFAGRWTLALDAFDPTLPWYASASKFRETSSHSPKSAPKFAFDLLVSEDAQERWATLLQKTLHDVGIEMTITRAAPDGEWWRRLAAGRFDAAAGGGALLTGVDAATWGSKSIYNVSGLVDPKLDELLSRQQNDFDPRSRAAREAVMISRVRDHLAQVPGLVRDHGRYLVSSRVHLDPTAPDEVWRWRLAR